MVKKLRKSELKTGDVVISRGGWQGVVLRGTDWGDLIKWFKDSSGNIIAKFRNLSDVREDLTYSDTKIVKVYRCSQPGLLTSCDVIRPEYLYWEEAREMTLEEIERALGYKVKVVL